MIPAVGLIVAVYAIARLLQVPIEALPIKARWLLLAIISVPAIIAIAYIAASLVLAGADIRLPSDLPR